VPIFQMSGKLQNLTSWIKNINELDINIILVEDGCDSKTLTELNEIIQFINPKKVRLISGFFGSPGAARNAGLELIEDGWVTFWDSDDVPIPSKYLEMIDVAELQNRDIAIGLYQDTSFLVEEFAAPNIRNGLTLFEIGLNPGLWRWAFHRKRIGSSRFNTLRMGEDQLFLMALEPFSSKLSYTREVVYKYFSNVEGQLTRNPVALLDLVKAIPTSILFVRNSDGRQKIFNKLLLSRQILSSLRKSRRTYLIKALKIMVSQTARDPRIAINFLLVTLASYRRKKPLFSSCKQYVSLTGGLGNQLFQLATAIEVSGNNLVTVISSLGKPRLNSEKLSEIQSFKFEKNIQFDNSQKSALIFSKTAGYMLRSGIWPTGFESLKFWKKFTRLLSSILISLHLREKVWINSAKEVGYEDLEVDYRRKELLIGYFQSSFWVLNKRTLEQMKSMTLPFFGRELKELKNLALSEEPLVVHVRLGDYRNEPTFGVLNKEYYAEALNHHSRLNSINKIWVFSDEISLAKELIPAEWHDRIRWIQEVDQSTSSTFEAMRLGTGYVIANSTFSWWAAMLSHNNPVVVAPEPWFVGQTQPLGLIPSNWTAIAR